MELIVDIKETKNITYIRMNLCHSYDYRQNKVHLPFVYIANNKSHLFNITCIGINYVCVSKALNFLSVYNFMVIL